MNPKWDNPKKSIPRHIKHLKMIFRNLESINIEMTLIREIRITDFCVCVWNQKGQEESSITLFKCFSKSCQPQILYLVEIFFRNEGWIKKFSDDGKLREVVIRQPILEEWIKVVLLTQRKFKKEPQNIGRKKNGKSKNTGTYNILSLSVEFSTWYLMVKTKL